MGAAILTSCRKGNDNVKEKNRVENSIEEDEMSKAISKEEEKYAGADQALIDSLQEAESELLKAKKEGEKAAEEGDRVRAQQTEERRKDIQMRINKIKNKIKESEDNNADRQKQE